jgi:hypothetical protein
MAAFAPLFDVSTVRLQSERLITLPDRYRSQPAPTRIARYESATLWLMELRAASAGSFDLRCRSQVARVWWTSRPVMRPPSASMR